jgi:hypothetical protein
MLACGEERVALDGMILLCEKEKKIGEDRCLNANIDYFKTVQENDMAR